MVTLEVLTHGVCAFAVTGQGPCFFAIRTCPLIGQAKPTSMFAFIVVLG